MPHPSLPQLGEIARLGRLAPFLPLPRRSRGHPPLPYGNTIMHFIPHTELCNTYLLSAATSFPGAHCTVCPCLLSLLTQDVFANPRVLAVPCHNRLRTDESVRDSVGVLSFAPRSLSFGRLGLSGKTSASASQLALNLLSATTWWQPTARGQGEKRTRARPQPRPPAHHRHATRHATRPTHRVAL